jgi:signal transduction histidine kinase
MILCMGVWCAACGLQVCDAGGGRVFGARVDTAVVRRSAPRGGGVSTRRRRSVREVSTEPAGSPALAALRRTRAQQEAALRWLRRLTPPLFLVVVAVVFTPGRPVRIPGSDVAAVLAVGGFVLGTLGALSARYRRAAVRVIFAVMLVASSALLIWLRPDGPGLAGLLAGVVLLAPRVPDRFPVALSVVGVTCLAGVAVAISHDSPTAALLSAIAIVGFPGMTLLARRLGQANEEAERLLTELEASRAAQARAAGLAERQRLAREMHDVLAHSLSGLMLQLEAARMLAAGDPGDPRLPGIIERAHHLGKSGLDEARRAIGMLRDDELPGPGRLAGLAAQFREVSGVPCQFRVSGRPYELPAEAGLAVYRVAQEALTNITRHACPERVEMHLGYEPRGTRLTVEDFGADGAAPRAAGDGSGYGLTGMRERAELLGGELSTAMTGAGFRVELRVPA